MQTNQSSMMSVTMAMWVIPTNTRLCGFVFFEFSLVIEEAQEANKNINENNTNTYEATNMLRLSSQSNA